MSWITYVFLWLAVLTALSACVLVTRQVNRLSADVASIWSAFASLEKAERLTPSRLAELAELNNAIGQGNQLLDKINRRITSQEWRDARKNNSTGTSAGGSQEISGDELKRQLRQKAGLLRGA